MINNLVNKIVLTDKNIFYIFVYTLFPPQRYYFFSKKKKIQKNDKKCCIT